MNTYTLNPPQSDPMAASAPTTMVAPVYAPATYQYPTLESGSSPAPVVAPVYMPSTYQYPKLESGSVPAPMVAPVYVPPTYQHPSYQNLPILNAQSQISKIRDWLPWSIVNIFLVGLIGIFPLIFSLVCRSKKRKNDIHGAKKMSTLALVFNIIATLMGVLSLVGLIVYLFIITRSMQNIDY